MDAAINRLQSTLVYKTSATSQEVLGHIGSMRSIDKLAESRQRWGILFIVLGILGLFAGIMTGAFNAPLPLVVVVVGGMVCLLVFGIVKTISASQLNLVDRRYLLLQEVVDMLRRDMASDALINVRVDFNAATANSKYQNKGKVGYWNVKFYADPWFSVQGRLLDGCGFLLELDELTQKRSRWKRTVRGKSKYKTKTKTSTVATLRLKAKPEKYPQLQAVAAKVENAISRLD